MSMSISDQTMRGLRQLCKRWKIKELALFGSAVRSDFSPDHSDVDVLYVRHSDACWGWKIVDLQHELIKLFGRHVDMVSKRDVDRSLNPYKRKFILNNYRVIYSEDA